MYFTTILVCIKPNGGCRILMLIKINEQSRNTGLSPKIQIFVFFFSMMQNGFNAQTDKLVLKKYLELPQGER